MRSNYHDDDYYDDDVDEVPYSPRKKRSAILSGDEKVHVPPMNEKPYYVKRLERIIGTRVYNVEHYLGRYDLETLKLIDAHHRLTDFHGNRFRDTSDQLLRSVLCILSHEGNRENSFDATVAAYKVIKEHHVLGSEDLTSLHPKQIAMVAAASKFLVETNLNEYAPPRLTHYVMSRLDDVESIISYVKQFIKRKDDANSVDLNHITEYLDSESPALREGGL